MKFLAIGLLGTVATLLFTSVASWRLIPTKDAALSPTIEQVIESATAEQYFVEGSIGLETLEPTRLSLFTPRETIAGTVTSVVIKQGATLESGEIAFTVDGEPIVAVASEEPIPTSLRRGDKGQAVLHLNRLLEDLGFLEPANVDSVFGWKTEKAVRSFNNELLDLDSRIFRLERTIWLGSEGHLVDQVFVEQGAAWPSGGTKVVELIQIAPEIHATSELLSKNETYQVISEGDLEGLLAVPSNQAEGWVIMHGLEPDQLSQIAPAEGEDQPSVNVVAIESQSVFRIPKAAIYVDRQGSTCVLTDSRSGVQVSIVDEAPAHFLIAADLGTEISFALAPLLEGEPPTC